MANCTTGVCPDFFETDVIINYLYFSDLTILGQKFFKFYWFFGTLKTPTFYSKINLPLNTYYIVLIIQNLQKNELKWAQVVGAKVLFMIILL